MKIVLYVAAWTWAAWVTVTLYACASRLHQMLQLLRRMTPMEPLPPAG